MDPIARLEAIEEIKQLKARYWRCLDTKDWEGLADVFTKDAELDMRQSGGGRAMGNRGAMEYIRGRAAPATMVHHGHQPEIRVISDTTATGIWAFEDMLQFPAGTSRDDGVTDLHGWGYYHERYQLTADGWRISFTSIARLREDKKMLGS